LHILIFINSDALVATWKTV